MRKLLFTYLWHLSLPRATHMAFRSFAAQPMPHAWGRAAVVARAAPDQWSPPNQRSANKQTNALSRGPIHVAVEASCIQPAVRKHTDESKRKISAANKGRVPWNAGRKHSEETRRRIAEGTRLAMERRAEAVRAERERLQREDPDAYERLTAAEAEAKEAKRVADANKAAARLEARRSARQQATKLKASRIKTGPRPRRVNFTFSAESRAKISESLRLRWQDPEYRARRTTNVTRSQATRDAISTAMKKRWASGSYRLRVAVNGSHTMERRAKIAESIRRKWQDPEYRLRATAGIRRAHDNETRRQLRIEHGGISPEARRKISESMKRRWQEPDFRQVQIQAMRKRAQSSAESPPSAGSQASSQVNGHEAVGVTAASDAFGDGGADCDTSSAPVHAPVHAPAHVELHRGSGVEAPEALVSVDALHAGALPDVDTATGAADADIVTTADAADASTLGKGYQDQEPALSGDVRADDVVMAWGDTIIDFSEEQSPA